MSILQLKYIVALLLCGGLMGTVFDLYNTVTGASKWLRWLRPTLDLLFWLASAAGVYYVLFVTDSGKLRMYTFALLMLGYILYRATFRQTVVNGAFAVVRFIASVFRFFYIVFRALVLRPLRILWLLLRAISNWFYRLLCVLENGLFWTIGFWFRVLQWPLAGRWTWTRKVRIVFATYWEGIWTVASKWIKKRTTGS